MMIHPTYARYMAGYNAEMDRRFIAAAQRLTDAQRRADRGVFWKSLHGTFNHILWVDHMWLNRLTGSPLPPGIRDDSDKYFHDFDAFVAARTETNARIAAWAEGVTQEFLDSDCYWFRGRPEQFVTPYAVLVAHMFTHQVHHRGQIHAVLTSYGEDTSDTSIWVMSRAPFSFDFTSEGA